MKKEKRILSAILLLGFLAGFMICEKTLAQTSPKFKMEKSVVAQGGGESNSPHFQQRNIIGQSSSLGKMSGTHFSLTSGFLIPKTESTKQGNIFITIILNTATVKDTLSPDGVVQLQGRINGKEGSLIPGGPGISLDTKSEFYLENIGGDYHQMTFEMAPDDTLEYRFCVLYDRNNPTINTQIEDEIIPGEFSSVNRVLISGKKDTVLAVQYYNRTGERQNQYWRPFNEDAQNIAVWFRVFMLTREGARDNYHPISDTVKIGVRGNELSAQGPLSWGQSNVILQREQAEEPNVGFHIYSGVVYYPRALAGQKQEYKFLAGDEIWEEGNLTGNRSFTIPAKDDTTLHWVFYGNEKPFGLYENKISERIEAENYWAMVGMELGAVSNDENDFYVQPTEADDYLYYKVIIPEAGKYDLNLRVALDNANDEGEGQILVDNVVLATFSIPPTGTGQVWKTIQTQVELEAGTKAIRVKFIKSPWLLNWMEFTPTVTKINDGPEKIPERFELMANYPNPFNPATHINYALPKPGHVQLAVYDVSGRLVKMLCNESKEPGFHAALWNGRNDSGNLTASGIYFYKIIYKVTNSEESFVDMRKMILMK